MWRPSRVWKYAREKVDLEGSCRRCGGVMELQAAHVIGRVKDQYPPIFFEDWKPYTVAPERILPLCRPCHEAFDGGRISIEALLTTDEAAQAVADAGTIEGARVRLTPRRLREVGDSASRMDPVTGARREAA
jgi:hypothetical protein